MADASNVPPRGPHESLEAQLLRALISEIQFGRMKSEENKSETSATAQDARSLIAGTGEQVTSFAARSSAKTRDTLRARSEGYGDDVDMWAQKTFGAAGWEEMYNEQISRSRGAGSGASGVFNRLTNYQFATGRGTSAALSGIGRSIRGSKAGTVYNVGEALYGAFSNSYAAEGAYDNLSIAEKRTILHGDPNASREVALGLTPDDSWTARERKAHENLQNENLGQADIKRNLATLKGKMFSGGSSLAALQESKNPAVRAVAARVAPAAEGFAGMAAGAGELMMAGARMAGPVGMAIDAGIEAYKFTKGTLYDPARSAAGLGYGFSYNPLSQGARVSMGRSFQTQADALFSMSMSPEQTAAARAAVEGMGLGGKGHEKAYDAYYGSMTDVMSNTQLGAGTLAPFYEQFMRQGGTTKELENLTHLLRDELPKAAAASSMSLDQMANSIQATVEAAKQQPLNARTSLQVTQQGLAAANAGGFKTPGLQNISSGGNMNINMIAANQNKVPYILVRNNPGLLLRTAAQQVEQQIGNVKDVATFDQRMQTDAAFAYKVSMLKNLYGLEPDDVRNMINVGLRDYQNEGVLAGLFTSATFKSNTALHDAAQKRYDDNPTVQNQRFLAALGNRKDRILTDPTVLGRRSIDLTTGTSNEVRSAYAGQISTLEAAIKDSGGNLNNFKRDLNAIGNDKGSAGTTLDFLMQKQKDLENKLLKSGQQSKSV